MTIRIDHLRSKSEQNADYGNVIDFNAYKMSHPRPRHYSEGKEGGYVEVLVFAASNSDYFDFDDGPGAA